MSRQCCRPRRPRGLARLYQGTKTRAPGSSPEPAGAPTATSAQAACCTTAPSRRSSCTTPPPATTTAAARHPLARLSAWKLSLYDRPADGTVRLVSGGGNKYREGKRVRFARISGHRDGNLTTCPGARLYGELPAVREEAARLQGYDPEG